MLKLLGMEAMACKLQIFRRKGRLFAVAYAHEGIALREAGIKNTYFSFTPSNTEFTSYYRLIIRA